MTKKLLSFTMIGFMALVLANCAYQEEQDLIKPGAEKCDTSAVKFSSSIRPLINKHCIVCHQAGGTGNGDFSTYGGLKSKVDNGSLRNRTLITKDMPPSGGLNACELQQLQRWLNEGAPNN
jgi:mono/diheme cytochrome c family protein